MTNCLVYGNYCNSSGYGGYAVMAAGSPCVNCTIVSNEVASGNCAAGGNFINCIIAGNTGGKDVGQKSGYATTTTLTNCIYGTKLAAVAADNIVDSKSVESVDQLKFESVDPDAANAFRLRHLSPARDAGYDVGFTSADRDLAGRSRVTGAAIDVGCYEAPPAKGLTIILRQERRR